MMNRTKLSCPTAILLAALAAAPLTAQTRFEERVLKTERAPTPGHAFAVFDADGDGDLDLLAGKRLHFNDGAGNLTDVTATHLSTGADEVRFAHAADFDGDGDDDLLLLEWYPVPAGLGGFPAQYLTLHQNDGLGRFTDVSSSAGLLEPRDGWVAVGDIDGDGDLDIAAATGEDTNFRIPPAEHLYVNDGSGQFTQEAGTRLPGIASTDERWSVALADLDGDGDLDLVFSYRNYVVGLTATRAYENDGSGHFAAPTATQLPATPLSAVEHAADVDADGDIDLLVGQGPTGLLRNDGTGRFTFDSALPPVESYGQAPPTLADVDGDQHIDLVCAARFPYFGFGWRPSGLPRLWVSDGNGGFAEESIARGLHGARGVAACAVDWDGDQDLDLTLGDGVRYLNDGRGRFGASWTPHAPSTADWSATAVLADLDGNGACDLIVGDRVLMQRDGRFADESEVRLPPSGWYAAVAGDFDGDGDLDLAGGRIGQGGGIGTSEPAIARNDGTGVFTCTALPQLPGTTVLRVVTADIDGDQDLDLVYLANSGQGNVLVYQNDGAARFMDVTATALPGGQGASCLTLGDVDGDGDPDLLLGRNGATLLQNDGIGVFTNVSATSLPALTGGGEALVLGDVDGDADLDLFVANGGQDRLLTNDGTGVFTEVTATHMPSLGAGSRTAVFADLDGDGDQDLVLGTWGGQFVLVNDGRGRFTDATTQFLVPTAEATIAIAVADLDYDGDQDLVIHHDGNVDPNCYCLFNPNRDTHVLTNLTAQLEAPRLAVTGQPFDFTVLARGRGTTGFDTALLALSLGPAHIPLPGLGVIGIDPSQVTGVATFAVPRAAGEGTLSLLIPRLASLVGLEFYGQAIVLGPGYPPRLTNRLRERFF